MKKNTIVRTLAVAGLALALSGIAVPAQASEDVDWTHLIEFNSQHGVSPEDQSTLLEKAKAGLLPDSMTGSEPVAVETPDDLTRIDRFEDGSVLVTTLEQPAITKPGQITPLGIAGCSLSSGGGYAAYSGCQVSQASSYATLSFTANYTRYTNGAQITRADTPTAQTYYGGCESAPTVSIIRGSQSGTLPAVATEHCHYVSYTGAASEDLYLSLRVTSGEAWVTDY